MDEFVYVPNKYKDRIRGMAAGYHICPTCGIQFHIENIIDYAYKENGYTFCRWNCLCAYRRWLNHGSAFTEPSQSLSYPNSNEPNVMVLDVIHAVDDAIKHLGFTTAWELICRLRKNGSIKMNEDYDELCKNYLHPTDKTARDWLNDHIFLKEKEPYISRFNKKEKERIAMAQKYKKAIAQRKEQNDG